MRFRCVVLLSCFGAAFGHTDFVNVVSGLNDSVLMTVVNKLDILTSVVVSMKLEMNEMKLEMNEKLTQNTQEMKLEMNEMKLEMNEMKLEMNEKLTQNTQSIEMGFMELHDFGASRVKVMQSASKRLTLKNCVGASTRHAVFFDGIITEIFTPHMVCSENMTAFSSVITCDGHDISMVAHCPEDNTLTAINITRNRDVKLGDEVVAFGYGDTAMVWRGFVSGIVDTDDGNHTHWNGTWPRRSGDFIMQSSQHSGMSGAAVSNGCGYTGMARAVILSELSIPFAIVSPVSTIQECISKNKEKLMISNAACINTIVDIPRYPSNVCD